MPQLKAWVEERENAFGVKYVLVVEDGLSRETILLGSAAKNKSRLEPPGHAWQRHLAEILGTDYTSLNPLLQYFAKDKLENQLQPIDDITLAKKVIEILAEKEPGIVNPENSKGSIARVGEHELSPQELQKLHNYFSNRNLPHPF